MARSADLKDYVAGWLDSSIHDFLAAPSLPATTARYALITCLDSNPNPASMRKKSPELKAVASKLEVLGTGLLLPSKLLIETERAAQILFGFDEVWFLPDKTIQARPPSGCLVGPARVDHARLQKLARWMADNSCPLALGGGEGLNFVVRVRGPARSLLGHSLEQPESALMSA